MLLYVKVTKWVDRALHSLAAGTEKPVFNGPFIKRNFVLNWNIFKSRHYHIIPWLNGNLVSEEKILWTLDFPFKRGFTVVIIQPVSSSDDSTLSVVINRHFY
jgi:hypothetical protein